MDRWCGCSIDGGLGEANQGCQGLFGTLRNVTEIISSNSSDYL